MFEMQPGIVILKNLKIKGPIEISQREDVIYFPFNYMNSPGPKNTKYYFALGFAYV